MLATLLAAVEETTYTTTELITFIGVPIVIVTGVLLALRRRKR